MDAHKATVSYQQEGRRQTLAPDDKVLRQAEAVDQHLRQIRRALVQAFEADKLAAGLTVPQMHAMAMLAQSQREGPNPLTVRELSERMGLAQSTVSGLVERLERKRFVRRLADPADRRCTRVMLTDAVKSYLEQTAPWRRLSPLIAALQQATDGERQTVVEGIAILCRLLAGEPG